MDDLDAGADTAEFSEDSRGGCAVVDDEFDGGGGREDIGDCGQQLGVSEETNAVWFV